MLLHIAPPHWFYGFDIFLQFLFAIIALLVGIFAWKIYKTSDQRNVKYLSLGFFIISLAYILQVVINLIIMNQINSVMCLAVKLKTVQYLSLLSMYTHIVFMFLGIILLFMMTLKKDDARVFFLLFFMGIIALLFSYNPVYVFYILTSLLLFVIFEYFFRHYLKKKKLNTLIIVFAFGFLFLSNILFFFALDYITAYVLGYLFELMGYILIFFNFVLVSKR